MTDPTPSTDARTAPVQPTKGVPFPARVPWHFHERAWSQYAAAGHGRQSAERIAERCGFGSTELIVLLLGRDYNDQRSYETLTPEDVAKVRDEIEAWTSGQAALRAELTRLRDDIQADQHTQDTLRAEVERWRAEMDKSVALHVAAVEREDALRARLASTEAERDRLSAELVGLREAATKVADAWGPVGRTQTVNDHLVPALLDTAAIGARVIEEAERRGRDAAHAEIAAAVTDWAHSSGLRELPLLTVIEELEAYRVRLEKSYRVATAAQDDAVDARDEARRERDDYKACWHRDVAKGQAAEERLRAERAEASAKWSASHAALVAERDAALAKLAALEEAVGTVPHPSSVWAPSGRTLDRIRAALSLAPSTALAERDARVRAEALGESDQRPEGASVDALRAVLASRRARR